MAHNGITGKKGCIGMLVLLAAMLLSGCFQIERTVSVKPDGSGTVEEIALLSKELTSMFDNMDAGGEGAKGEQEKKSAKNRLAEEEKTARAKAAEMGEGVTLLSVTPLKRGDFEGYRVVYGFRDINKLKLAADATPADQKGKPGKFNSYQLTRGEQNVLVFRNGSSQSTPPAAEEGQTAAQSAAGQEQQPEDAKAALEMLKQIFNGMRIAERIVVVDGTITESNAAFRAGSVITVMDVDFGKLLETKPEELSKLQSIPQDDRQKLLIAMGKIQGFKVDMNEELRVVFKGK